MNVSFARLKALAVFILKFMRPQRLRFFWIFLLSICWSLDQTLWPYLTGKIIDTLTHFDLDRWAAWPTLKWQLFAGAMFWFVLDCGFRTRDFLRAKALPQLEAEMRMAMFDHIQRHSPRYFNEHFAGSLANKISDMTTQTTSVLLSMMLFIPTIVTCFLTMVMFAFINPLYALILAVWLAIHFIICTALTPKCSTYSEIHGEARSVLAGKIVDSLTNNFTVNLFARFKDEMAYIAAAQKIEREKNYQSQFYTSIMILLLTIIGLIGGLVINGFTFYGWLHNTITTGEIIQIFNTTLNVMFIIWFSGIILPQLFQSIGILSQALSVMQDPQDTIDTPNAQTLSIKQGEIIFQNVSFSYGKKKLFENKNVLIKGGERVGLVGYSGAGKSTFVNLILRFYPLEKGHILIDKQDINQITLDSLRQQVTLIPQDPLLFHRTLEENIQYGRLNASQSEVLKASELAHCHEFIMKCPQGYATLVGERGTKLSGGERQRIAIARAILAAAPILILDEATSSLDSVTEKYIQESLEKLMQNRTTIVIAHRLSTLSKMDRIIVFDQGKIIEEGSSTELIARNGHFAKMWNMQAGGFLPSSSMTER